MDIITRLATRYQNRPPLLSFGGTEGNSVNTRIYSKWPEKEEIEYLGAIVWRDCTTPTQNIKQPEGYCVVEVCLDASGLRIPEALPLPQEMRGHKLSVMVYVDILNCIRMKAIGGFSIHKEE